MFGKWCLQQRFWGGKRNTHTHVLDKTSQSSSFMILGRVYIKKINGAFDSVTSQQFLEEIKPSCDHLRHDFPSLYSTICLRSRTETAQHITQKHGSWNEGTTFRNFFFSSKNMLVEKWHALCWEIFQFEHYCLNDIWFCAVVHHGAGSFSVSSGSSGDTKSSAGLNQ